MRGKQKINATKIQMNDKKKHEINVTEIKQISQKDNPRVLRFPPDEDKEKFGEDKRKLASCGKRNLKDWEKEAIVNE